MLHPTLILDHQNSRTFDLWWCHIIWEPWHLMSWHQVDLSTRYHPKSKLMLNIFWRWAPPIKDGFPLFTKLVGVLIYLVITIKLFKILKIHCCNLVQYDMLKIIWLTRGFSSIDSWDSQPFKVYVNEFF
jgi:hypothetical protein